MIRQCALVYAELKAAHKSRGTTTNDFLQLQHTFEAACPVVADFGSPESLLWRLWFRIESDVRSSSRRVENVCFGESPNLREHP